MTSERTVDARTIIEATLKRKEFYDRATGATYTITGIYSNEQGELCTRISYTNSDCRVEEGSPLAKHLSAPLHNYSDLGDHGFPVRIRTGLRRSHGVLTLDDVCNLTEKDILHTSGLGAKSLTWVKEYLASQGLSLKKK